MSKWPPHNYSSNYYISSKTFSKTVWHPLDPTTISIIYLSSNAHASNFINIDMSIRTTEDTADDLRFDMTVVAWTFEKG